MFITMFTFHITTCSYHMLISYVLIISHMFFRLPFTNHDSYIHFCRPGISLFYRHFTHIIFFDLALPQNQLLTSIITLYKLLLYSAPKIYKITVNCWYNKLEGCRQHPSQIITPITIHLLPHKIEIVNKVHQHQPKVY